MKLFTALATASIVLTGVIAPAANAWGNGPQAAAAAYCGARSQGASQAKAERTARGVLVAGRNVGVAQVLMHGKGMMQATGYLVRSMCPEYAPGSSRGSLPTNSPKSTISIDEAAATALSWGQF